MLQHIPISYAENLFPNKFCKTASSKPNLTNGVSVALRNVNFEPPFMLSSEDVKIPTSKASQILNEDYDKAVALQKLKLLQKGTETDDLIKDYFHQIKMKKGYENRAEYDKKVRDHLLQQGVSNGFSEEQVKTLVDHQLAHKAILNADAQVNTAPPAEPPMQLATIRGEEALPPLQNDEGGWYAGWNGGFGESALPTSSLLFSTEAASYRPPAPATPARAAEAAGIKARADDNDIAPKSALGYVAATLQSAVNMAVSRVSKPPAKQSPAQKMIRADEDHFDDLMKMSKAETHYKRTQFNKVKKGLGKHAADMKGLKSEASEMSSKALYDAAKKADWRGGKQSKAVLAPFVAKAVDRGELSREVLTGGK